MKKYLYIIALTMVFTPLANAGLKSAAVKSFAKLAAKDVITHEDLIIKQDIALDIASQARDDGAKIPLVKKGKNGLALTANAELMPNAIDRIPQFYRNRVEINVADMSLKNKRKVFDIIQNNKNWLERGESTRRFLEAEGDVQLLKAIDSTSSDYPVAFKIQTTTDGEYLERLASLLNEIQEATQISNSSIKMIKSTTRASK